MMDIRSHYPLVKLMDIKANSQTVDGTDGCGKIYPTNFKINNVDYYYHKYLGLFASSQETMRI